MKEYLPYYLGQEVEVRQTPTHKIIGKLVSLMSNSVEIQDRYGVTMTYSFEDFKLLLRPLSSMTEEEESNSPKAKLDKWGNITIESMAELINYLRGLGIDC